MRASISRLGQPLAMRSRVWVSQACGSTWFIFGRRQKARDSSPCAAAAIRAGEERVLPCDRLRPDGALNRIGIQLDASVRQKPFKRGTARESIADRLGQLRLTRQLWQFLFP